MSDAQRDAVASGAPRFALVALDCPDLPAGWTLPEGYDLDWSGVWLIRETHSGVQRVRVTYGPLLPVGVFIDPAGNQMLELVWRDHGRWVGRVVARSIAKNGRKLIAALGDAGLPAVDADAKALERWLAAAEARNRNVIRRQQLARWLGWQPDGSFLASADGDRRIEPAHDEQAAAIAAHRSRGSLDGWQTGMKTIEPYPVAKTCVYAALAAVILDVVGVDSFTIDISGRSTRGKTTAAKIGLSVWADPSEKGDGLFSWRTTLIAVEKRLNICRGLPVVIDETRAVKFPELIDQVIYQVPKNHGQARGGGWPSLLPWSAIVISTGEQSALSFTTHQGAAARVLSITKPPFGSGDGDNGRTAADVGRVIDDNHGTAGPAFADRLQTLLATPDGKAQLIDRHRDLTEQHRGGNDMADRRAPMLACLILAAELAHAWDIVPFNPISADDWAEVLTGDDATDNRPEMALDIVREYVAANAGHLWEPGRTAGLQPPTGWVGRRIKVNGAQTVALLPERLREALRRCGYVLDAVLPGWQELGYLVKFGKDNPDGGDRVRKAGDKGKGAYQPVRSLGGTKTRLYVFTPGLFDADDNADDTEPEHRGG